MTGSPLNRNWLGRASSDLLDALRAVRRGRGTTVVIVAILAGTMATATTVFSVVDGVALRPLPYGTPARLVDVSLPGSAPGRLTPAGPRHYFAWSEGNRTLQSIGAARLTGPVELDVNGTFEMLTATAVTVNLFDVLAVRPAAGRFFRPEDERPGSDVVVLSHALWLRRFDGDPAVIGRSLNISGRPLQVVGIIGPGVRFPMNGDPPDIYLPYTPTAADRSSGLCCMFVVGRLLAGVPVERAAADLQRLDTAVVTPLQDQAIGSRKTWLYAVLAAVGVLLLLSTVNVGCLLLTRAAGRTQELATRIALGASRFRLAHGLIIEGLVLALASAAGALALSLWGVEFAKSAVPPGLPRLETVTVDGRVMGTTVAVALIATLVFSTAPAWLVMRGDLGAAVGTGRSSAFGGRRLRRALTALLVTDSAAAGALLVMATLVVASLTIATSVDLGFDAEPERVVSFAYRRSLVGVDPDARPEAVAALEGALLDSINAVPGVLASGLAAQSPAPLHGSGARYGLTLPGRGEISREDWPEVFVVTPGYFRVLEVRLIRGRVFTTEDSNGSSLAVVINDVAAQRFFPGRDPVGLDLPFQGNRTIVGVVQAVRSGGPEAEVLPALFLPASQRDSRYWRWPVTFGSVIARLDADPQLTAERIRLALRPVLGEVPEARFLSDRYQALTAFRRFNAQFFGVFGAIAALIAGLGVYSTMAFVVSHDVRSLGVRLALGAQPSRLAWNFISRALRQIMAGATIGLGAAWLVSGYLSSLVFGLPPDSTAAYLTAAALLACIGLLAVLPVALRAARLDPLVALKNE